MKTYIAVLFLSAFVAWLLTPIARRLAFWVGAVDQPEARKLHTRPMPRLGGLAVFAGFCSPFPLFYLIQNRVSMTFLNFEKLFVTLLVGSLLVIALGIYDDMKGAGAGKKLLVQLVASLVLYYGGFQITVLSNPFGDAFQLGWMSLPVTVFWIVGITNAMNLLDGIDGLAAGVTACIALSLAVINVLNGQILVALLTLGLAGACLGFLPHNFAPARVFLGDTGSLFLGLMLACIGIVSLFKATTATLLVAPLILFGLPIADTTTVVLSRFRRGKPIFMADKNHLHHRMLRLGWNHREACFFFYAITLALGGIAIDLSLKRSRISLVIGVVLVLILIFMIRFFGKPQQAGPSKSGTGAKQEP